MRAGPALAALAALLVAAAPAPPARADYSPVGSGSTRLTLDHTFLASLRSHGVKLTARAPAKISDGAVVFPASGGKFDPVAEQGTVEHDGALVLTAGPRSVPLKALALKTTRRRSPYAVKAGGSQLKLADAGRVTIARAGFGERVAVADLTLGARLATRLGKKLRLRGVFEEGDPLGRALTVAQPLTAALRREGKVVLTLDPGFAAKLESHFIAVNPIFPAERPGAEFSFPISGGSIAPDAFAGGLEAQGSLELLQLGGGQVFWAEPWLDLTVSSVSAEADVEPSPPYGGKIGRVGLGGLALAGAAPSASPQERTIRASGLALSLDAAMAAAFNQAFAGGQPVFAAGEPVGAISFLATAQ